MKKPVYKLLDEKGRILIPKEFRQIPAVPNPVK